LGSAKATESPKAASRRPIPAGADRLGLSTALDPAFQAQERLGNAALGRLLHAGVNQRKLALSEPSDAHEREADRIADQLVSPSPTRSTTAIHASTPARAGSSDGIGVHGDAHAVVANLGGAQAIDPSVRADFEPQLARDLSDVRIHASAEAAHAARAVQARAFTIGTDIAFASGQYRPETKEGRRLIAHELAHVVQQSHGAGAGSVLHRKPEPGGSSPPQPQSPSLGAGLPPLVDALARIFFPLPPAVVSTIKVSAPGLPAEVGEHFRDETFLFSIPIDIAIPIVIYAVPASSIYGTKEDYDAGRCGPLSPFSPFAPPILSSGPPVAMPWGSFATGATGGGATAPMTSTPAMPSEVMMTPAGPLTIIGGDADFKLTLEATKLAVGAASTTVLVGKDGAVRIVDAGVHQVGGRSSPALIEATIARLRQIIGNRPIVEVLISHSHFDHISLLERLAETFEIRTLRVNAAQRLPSAPGSADDDGTVNFQDQEKAVARGQEVFRRRVALELRTELDATEAEWQSKQPIEADSGVRNERFRTYRETTIASRLQTIEQTRIQVEVPSPEGMRVVEAPLLGEIPIPEADSSRTGAGRGAPEKPGQVTVADPGMGKAHAKGVRPSGPLLDTMESNYVIDLPGARMLFFPDARAPDFARIRDNFENEIARLGRPAKFQVWDITHHAQSGFRTGSVEQLRKMVSMLNDFSRVSTQFGGKTVDAVMVSAETAYIDPASVFLLRSLGFEVYVAHGGQEVALLEVTLGTGETITGMTSKPYVGIRPSDLLIRRGQAGVNERNNRIKQLESEFKSISKSRTKEANERRKAIESEVERLKGEAESILKKQDAYIEGIARDVGKGPFDAPKAPGTEVARAEEIAFREELNRLNVPDQPVVGEGKLAHFEAEALVITGIRAPVNPTTEQQRVIDLRQQVNDLVEALPKSETPVATRTELIERLKDLKAATEAIEAKVTDPDSKRLIDLEKARVDALLQSEQTALAETPGGKVSYDRGPNGELVTHRVLVEKLPGETGEPAVQPGASPTMKRALQGVEVVGRGLGVVMIVTSVNGIRHALASPKEEPIPLVHHGFGFSIGARIAARVPVHGGQLVLLTVLEILDTASQTFGSQEEAKASARYAVIRGGINLVMGAIGQAMTNSGARSGNLGLVIAGQAIALGSFLVDYVLDKLGIYEWLERRYAFLPSEVTAVSQEIRKLMNEYRVILGGLELSKRSDVSLSQLGASSPTDIRTKAIETATARRADAQEKERDLVSAFEDAYGRARTSYAGLRELDFWRNEFFKLQAQTQEISGPSDRGQRTQIESQFAAIERKLSLDSADEDAIRGLEQWDKIGGRIEDLDDALDTVQRQMIDPNFSSASWETAAKKERELAQMLDNARYRLDPTSQAPYRTTAMLTPGSAARGYYEKELRRYELWATQVRGRLASLALGRKVPSTDPRSSFYERTGPLPFRPVFPMTGSMVLDQARAALDAFRLGMTDTYLPTGVIPESLASSSAVAAWYQTVLNTNRDFAAKIYRLQALESSVRGMLATGQGLVTAYPAFVNDKKALKELQDAFESAVNQRRKLKMLLYPSEVAEEIDKSKAVEGRRFAESLGQSPGLVPLSEYEFAALESGSLRGPGRGLSDVESQLRLAPPGAKLFRFTGSANQNYSGGAADVPSNMSGSLSPKAKLEDNIIVALAGDAPKQGTSYWKNEYVYIVPVNRAAVLFFGGRGKVSILKDTPSLDVPYVPATKKAL
jgi:hypothetical protein